MPILPRYFLKLFFPLFGLCLGIFTGVLLMNYFIRLFNLAVMKGISLFWIASCFTRLLPYFLSLALPMAFLVALLMTLGQLSEKGEVTALRSCGFSFSNMTWPLLAVSVLLSLLLLYINHKASPDAFHSFRKRYTLAAQQLSSIDLQAGSFMKLGQWKLYAKKVEQSTGKIEGAYLVRSGSGQNLRIEALRGSLRVEKGQGVGLELVEGNLMLPDNDPETFTSASFKRYHMFVPLANAALIERAPDIPEIDSFRLYEKIKDAATTQTHRLEYAVEIAVRSAGALSPFVFFWIGAPLGLQVSRNAKGSGFAISLGILFCFYGLLALGMGLGRRHELLSWTAPWLADAAGLIVGIGLTRRAAAR